MTAPVASGWSGCRVGLAPTGKRRLSTAHATLRLLDGLAGGKVAKPATELQLRPGTKLV
jgi:hypothetical protein